MGFLKNWQGSRGIMQLVIIHLFCWLAWSVSVSLAKFDRSEGVTGSLIFPALEITCIANLAVFLLSLIRGRLKLEIGAKLENIDATNGMTTYKGWLEDTSVVMLTNRTPNYSIRDFMTSNAHIAKSIVLQFVPLPLCTDVITVERCECSCKCIVFSTVERVTVMLARRMPKTLKRLSDSQCLLPCLTCLRNGCHGCNHGLLLVEETGLSLREGELESPLNPHVVCTILEGFNPAERICICIPMHDVWTKLLVRTLRSKDAISRGVRDMASKDYLVAGGRKDSTEPSVEYSIGSFIVPRLIEILINLVLTGWFMIDGFSSAFVARWTIRDYVVDSKGSGFAANAFLSKVVVKSDANNTCQLLTFRGDCLGIRTLAFTVGSVNMVCSIVWALIIAFDDGFDGFRAPTLPGVALIITAIGIAMAMEMAIIIIYTLIITAIGIAMDISMFELSYLCSNLSRSMWMSICMFVDTLCFVSGNLVAGTLGVKAFGKWIYVAVQILVWFRWLVVTAAFNNDDNSTNFLGTWTYSSAFLLNAVLAGVRSKWGLWVRKDNHLWSRKLLI